MENIIENNKLIAEFMGYDPITLADYDNHGFLNDLMMIVDITDCRYSNSWDWLMPVVGRIVQDESFIEVHAREYLMDIVPYCRLEDTYNAVIEFIKWFNLNK